ncbi:MAG: signal peptide peptidase SppA [Acetobacteraceae bacterium]|nr:signal peptide peptidase SppA [Acetobacteraceae bacterium]
MALEADLLLDRRRIKRQLALWRVLAVLAVVLGLVFLLPRDDGLPGLPGGAHVARLKLEGFIGDDARLQREVDRAARDPAVKALIVAVDSPGGSVAGGEGIARAVRRLREAGKPVVAVMGGTAASAGYMVALPAERIFAREATVTGSIGVLLQSFEVSELMARLGVRAETLASGVLKDQPSPFRPLTEEGRAALSAVVTDLYGQFVAMVVEARRMPEARVRELADGRIFTGRQAVELGLVDAIGGEAEARRWLREAHGVPEHLRTRDLDPRGAAERALAFGSEGFWGGAARALRAAGLVPLEAR